MYLLFRLAILHGSLLLGQSTHSSFFLSTLYGSKLHSLKVSPSLWLVELSFNVKGRNYLNINLLILLTRNQTSYVYLCLLFIHSLFTVGKNSYFLLLLSGSPSLGYRVPNTSEQVSPLLVFLSHPFFLL